MTMDSLLYAVFAHEMFLDIIILETFLAKTEKYSWLRWKYISWGGGGGWSGVVVQESTNLKISLSRHEYLLH